MRCIACAGEMQLIRSEPDQSMLLSGQQLCSFKCPNCHPIEPEAYACALLAAARDFHATPNST
jgi:hypothetical protein